MERHGVRAGAPKTINDWRVCDVLRLCRARNIGNLLAGRNNEEYKYQYLTKAVGDDVPLRQPWKN